MLMFGEGKQDVLCGSGPVGLTLIQGRMMEKLMQDSRDAELEDGNTVDANQRGLWKTGLIRQVRFHS